MAPASSTIKYPSILKDRYNGPKSSGNLSITGMNVLVSILNQLGKTADLVESLGNDSKAQTRLCKTIVECANELTAQFDKAVDYAKKTSDSRRMNLYGEEAPGKLVRAYMKIVKDLQPPLQDYVKGNQLSDGTFDFRSYERTLEDIISEIQSELGSWIKKIQGPQTEVPRIKESENDSGRKENERDPRRKEREKGCIIQ